MHELSDLSSTVAKQGRSSHVAVKKAGLLLATFCTQSLEISCLCFRKCALIFKIREIYFLQKFVCIRYTLHVQHIYNRDATLQ